MPENLQRSGFADEKILAAVGYTRALLVDVLTENALEVTPERVDTLIRRLVSTTQQAAAEELDEALRNLRFSDALTERQAETLRSQIAQEIAEDGTLRSYFGHCCGIEVEHAAGGIRFQVHLYYEAYGRHYAEIWVRDEASWKETLAQIRQEIKEDSAR
ncbi:MAG: hypothetical protein H0U76_22275 [Ktedonobacteraceae bacterium]|nr:hypothetical protein [Ktedonobacteraceae bacterium]